MLVNMVAHKAYYKMKLNLLFQKIARCVLVEDGYVLSSNWGDTGQKMLF